MKSVLAIVLASLMLGSSLLPGFSLDQSSRWGELVQHYAQHRKTNVSLSFLDFIALHYGANSDHQKHPNHSHQHLPVAGHVVPVAVPAPLHLMPLAFAAARGWQKVVFWRKADLYSFLAVFGLINPPRR